MRFNDEVQFTLMCVRVPDPVADEIVSRRTDAAHATAPHRSISTDCMTQGDTVCLPPMLRAVYDAQNLASSAKGFMRSTALAKPSSREQMNKMLNDVFEATVRKPDGYDELWAKYNNVVEAMYSAPAAWILDRGQITLYPDPDANTAVGEIAPPRSRPTVKGRETCYFVRRGGLGPLSATT